MQGNSMMVNPMHRSPVHALLLMLLLALGVVLSTACTVRPETPRERIAAAQLTLKTVYATAADVKARGQLSPQSEAKVLETGAAAQVAIDQARSAVTGNGDPQLIDAALRLLEARLLALEAAARDAGAAK